MPDKVLILLYISAAGREALANFGYNVQEFIFEAKRALAECFLECTGDDFDIDKIDVDQVFEKEKLGVDILLIVITERTTQLQGRQRDLGKQSRRFLRSQFVREGVDAETIPSIQVEVLLTGS